MPDRSRVEEFISTVVCGDHVAAIADFYHEDAFMQENDGEPRKGRDRLLDHEKAALERIRSMETHPVNTYLLDGDNVVIQWTFDIVDAEGQKRRLEELAMQRWKGDRIQEERFYYDSARKWHPIND
ncbi:MAG: nuclear transport factor 2 family protein [Proteobacteria bacterium]|nr:nuclear transport factor 2 family protein [Pseudomonadota bacterium]